MTGLAQGIITTIAGGGASLLDGVPATQAVIQSAFAPVADASGNLYFAETDNARVRRVGANGMITTVAGNGTAGYSGDGGPATAAQLQFPVAVALDAAGNLYIADSGNYRIRKVAPNGVITTAAGTGNNGTTGDGGPAVSADIGSPTGVVVDHSGNIYFSDITFFPFGRIRKVSPAGTISTIAGGGNGPYDDGYPAADSSALAIFSLALGQNDLIFFGAYSSIRWIGADGKYASIGAGNLNGAINDGAPAPGNLDVSGLAIDNSGDIFFASSDQNVVRMITADGILGTVAGIFSSYTPGVQGDGGFASQARLNQPQYVGADAAGNIYIVDDAGGRIRKIAPQPLPVLPGNSVISAGTGYPLETPPLPVTGSIAAIYGTEFTTLTADASWLPLPLLLLDTSVRINGVPAPLFSASYGQVNVQIPWEVTPGPATVQIVRANKVSEIRTVTIAAYAPAIFTSVQPAIGYLPAAVDMRGQPISQANPAKVGQIIQLFCTGLGPADETLTTRQPAPFPARPAQVLTPVTVNGVPALFAGPAPGLVGVYQVNFTVPPGSYAVQITIEQGGKQSNLTDLFVSNP